MRLWIAGLGIAGLALILAGCATLPADEAGAFRTLSSADRDAFTALGKQESDVVNAIMLARDDGSLERDNCDLGGSGACELVLQFPREPEWRLGPTAPETRALIGALAAYGDSMATLAEAADVTAAQEAAGKAGGSVKNLVNLVPGAPSVVGPVIDGIVWASNQGMVQKRRSALRQAAEKADPAVKLAAERMEAISARLRSNLERAAVRKLDAAWEAWQRAPDAATRQQKYMAVTAAAAELNTARQVRTDYSALADGHHKLVQALNGAGDPVAAMGELETFIGILSAARAAAEKDAEPK